MEQKPGKWERTHDLLKRAATELFLEKRSANVSMDDIADRASVARRTLFNHFSGKEILVMEITAPILSEGLHYLEEINRWDTISIDEVINLFLYLWKRHGQSLNLLYAVDFEDFQDLKELHGRYIREYMNAFKKISEWPDSMADKRQEIAVLFSRVFVNIFNSLNGMEDQEKRFAMALKGLIKGIEMDLP